MRPRPCSPGGYERRSTPHLSVRQRWPLRNSFCPSRRHCLHCGPVSRAMSDAPALSGSAAVVRLRGDILDASHLEASGLQRSDRRLAPGPGALHEHLHLLEAVLDPLAGGGVGGHLRRERSRLAAALEPGAAGGLPRNDVPLAVGERDDRVVERSLDVRLPDRDVLAHAAAAALRSPGGWAHFLPAFFLPATCMRLGPLRVRALVLVFCPWTGRPRRWRRPR